jgi:hypothetical protein
MTRSPGRVTEQEKRRSRARHRQAIHSAYGKAKLCREQYDTQRERGEIGAELYNDMVDAAFRLYSQLRPAVIDTDFEDDVAEVGEVFEEVFAADERLSEIESVEPKTFAAIIDRLEAITVKGGLDEVDA